MRKEVKEMEKDTFDFNAQTTNWQGLFADPPAEGLERFVVEDFQASGLKPETLERARVFLFKGKREDLREVLGYASYQGHELTRGFLLVGFPYFNTEGEIELMRFKVIPSLRDVKYLHPTGKPPIPYILPEVWEIAHKPHKPIAITEGEKKALKLIQEGLSAIALSGVWNFRAGETARDEEDNYLLKELREFKWEGRVVYLFFDADSWTNPQVRHALFELSFKLTALGAVVRIATWNLAEGKGIDDYLAQKDDPQKALQELLEKAKPLEGVIRREDLKLVVKTLASVNFEDSLEIFTSLTRTLARKVGLTPSELQRAVWREKLSKEESTPAYTEEELKQAEELLKDPNLVKKWLNFVGKLYLGREKEKLLVKLATLTRHFDSALSVVLTGTASVGKSKLIEAVLQTVHREAVEDFTRTSETYLLYRKKPLDHMIVTYFEMAGTKHSAHIIRTALSEGRLKLGTVVKTDKGLEPREIEKDTQGLVILSTFASGGIDWELATRVLKVEITHDPDLARRVLEWKASQTGMEKEEIEKEARIWRAVDYLIEPANVVIPYAQKLAELFPVEQERYLRDYDKVLLLIKASALWHQHQRPRDDQGRIIAQHEDYALVYELRDLIAEAVSTVPDNIRRFLEAVQELSKYDDHGNYVYPTREEVRRALGVSEATIKRYVKTAVDLELLEVTGRGKKQTLRTVDIPDPVSPLPEPRVLFNEPMSCFTETVERQGEELAHIGMSRNEPNEPNDSRMAQTAHLSSNGGEPIQSVDSQGVPKNSSTAQEKNISLEEVKGVLREVYHEDS